MAELRPSELNLMDHLDPNNNPQLHRGLVQVDASTDWVAKIDMTNLKSGTRYVFAFHDGTRSSPVGKTRTAPGRQDAVAELRYAVFTCSQMERGYFHAYDIASTIEDLDLWIHTGDYFYDKCCDLSIDLKKDT